ncbi:MAG: hypothetical protein NXI10_00860 [bacterium]|nr:hypothetical protein [bacterium]
MKVNIKLLKSKLEKLGYYIREIENDVSEIHVCQDLGGTNDIGIKEIKTFCRVQIGENEYNLFYIEKSLIRKEVFNSQPLLIKYIKDNYVLH